MAERSTASPPRLPALVGLALIGLIGLVAAVIAVRLGLWRQGSPGEGLFPFIVASAVVVFSALSAAAPPGARPEPEASGGPARPLRVAAYLVALVFYAAMLEALGFIVATAVTVAFILRGAERYSWRMVAALTAGTIVFCQILFVRWLGAMLPTGFLWDRFTG